jgi:anti-sigma B factor antagonist
MRMPARDSRDHHQSADDARPNAADPVAFPDAASPGGAAHETARAADAPGPSPSAMGHNAPEAGADGWAVVPVPGDLDFYSAPDFEKLLASVAAGGSRRVVVDMHDVAFMDSTGLRVLLGAARELRESGGVLRLAAPREQVLRVLELTQVEPLLPTFADVGSACHD